MPALPGTDLRKPGHGRQSALASLFLLDAMVTDSQMDLKLDLDRDEYAVMRILRNHRGREDAIQVDRISAMTSLNERHVRQIVRHLIDEHRAPVGSSTKKPCGYYWIMTGDEAIANFEALRRRGINILARASRIKGTTLPELLGQIKLEMERGKQ